MAGFQQAANTITGAPARFKVQKSIVEELQRDLAGEQATTAAYGEMTNLFTRVANNEDVSVEEIKKVGESMKQVPVQNREMFAQSLTSLQSLTGTNVLQRMRISALQKRLDEYEKRPNVPKAIAMTSSYDLQAKEEMKSGTTKTSR